MNWTTRLDPALTSRYDVNEVHCACWLPPNWAGKGRVIGLIIPECELTISFCDDDSDQPLTMVNHPPTNRNIKHWLRSGCEMALEFHSAFYVIADSPQQIIWAAKLIARLLPLYQRTALERMYEPDSRHTKEKLS
jgi:hypothetical protein